MSEFTVRDLLVTPIVTARDICCRGSCRHRSAEEYANETQLVFPYRGVFGRHLGRDDAVAEANQVLIFNAAEAYRVSHPVPGGDACLNLIINELPLRELAPRTILREGSAPAFRLHRLRIDPQAQLILAQLRHRL